MIRNLKDQKTLTRSPGVDFHILAEPAEIYGAGRLYARITIAPGASLAHHRHEGEMESFYIIKGTCRVTDNVETFYLEEGDVMVTPDGETHSVSNDGDEPVELIALIISRKQGVPGSSAVV